MARTPYSAANPCSLSMLTLPILTRPSYSSASSSRTGAIILQGPHHSAQKSTRIGVDDSSTSFEKLSCVKLTIFKPAITVRIVPSYPLPERIFRSFTIPSESLQIRQTQPEEKRRSNSHQCCDCSNDRERRIESAHGVSDSDGNGRGPRDCCRRRARSSRCNGRGSTRARWRRCMCWGCSSGTNGRSRRRPGTRTAGRQSGQLDCWRCGRLGRQINTNGLFLGLDLAGFFLWRHRPCWDIWNVLCHNVSFALT